MITPLLSVSELRFSVGTTTILDGVTFSLPERQTVGIIGPNGSGKTTLFNCLSGFSQVNSGTIHGGVRDVTHLSAFRRARLGMGRTFQSVGIFRDLTVLENMILALESKDRSFASFFRMQPKHKKAAFEFLEKTGLSSHAEKKAASLSGGQMRLLELARGLAYDYQLFLLDEPTAGVSPRMKEEVAKMIINLQADGKSILIIEHDLHFIKSFCTRILVLVSGKIALEGTPESVRQNALLQEIYFGR